MPPWWPVTAADDLKKHPTLLFEGTAKVVRRGRINKCGEKCAALVDERSATMDVVVKTARFVNTSTAVAIEKHASELVSELVWLEYLRGQPGIPVLWGAWAMHGRKGLTYVVEHAGEPMNFFIPSENFQPERYADERYKAFVRSKPLATAKAFIECFHSFSQVGGFFLDDFVPHQFVYSAATRGVRRIALVDGPKLLGRRGALAPLYENSSHVIETAPRACAGDAACPHTKNSHCCCGSPSPNGARPDGSRGAPESKGRCADRACVPLSSATHVFDVAAQKWALPFIEQLAREDGHLVVADGLRALVANMTRRDADARPSFSEVLGALHALRTLELEASGKDKHRPHAAGARWRR